MKKKNTDSAYRSFSPEKITAPKKSAGIPPKSEVIKTQGDLRARGGK